MAKFELKDDIQPKWNVPFASLPLINEELDRLERSGVLLKIQYSQWASPTISVKKKSKEILVCADFSTELNTALKDYYYILSCTEEIFARLNGEIFFSKIELSDAYLQMPVEEKYSELLCINTHCSLYKFVCFPFWVKVAPAIFLQQVMDTMRSDLDFAVAYLNDILMNCQNIEQHKEHVHKVFPRIQGYGLKLNESKCDFFMGKIKYLKHIIDKDSKRPDPERATTIKDMPAPENVSAL